MQHIIKAINGSLNKMFMYKKQLTACSFEQETLLSVAMFYNCNVN